MTSNGSARSLANAIAINGEGAVRIGSTTTGYTGAFTFSGAVSLGAGNHPIDAAQDITFSNTISDGGATPGGIVKQGAYTLTLSGANTYTGDTVHAGGSGTLLLKNQLALQNSTLNYTGAATLTFDSTVAANAFTFGGLKGSSNIALQNSAATAIALTVGGNNATTTYSGALSAGGSLTKAGSGMLTLIGNNTYTGATSVNGGTLAVNGSLTSAITVASGATLQGTGSATGGLITSGTVAPGNSIESLGVGAVTFNATSTLAYELDSSATLGGTSGDLLYSSGSLSIASGAILTLSELAAGTRSIGEKLTLISYTGTWDLGVFTYLGNPLSDGGIFSLGSNSWQFDYNDTTGGPNFSTDQMGATAFVTMTVIPEPGTAGIVATFLAAALLRRRRRAE